MRIVATITAVLALLLGALTTATAPAGAATVTHTERIVVRPVTSSGRAAPGYTVSAEPSDQVDCSFRQPSPSAVDNDILWCSPDAAYALACWRSVTPNHVLCLRNATRPHLVKLPTSGRIAHATAYQLRAPLDLRLGNGVFCAFRDGGAASSLQGHPRWAAYYYCTKGLAIWAPMNARNWGVDRSHPAWSVHVAKSNGTGRLVTRAVAKAWFVGTRG